MGGFPRWSSGKESACQCRDARDGGLIPRLGRFPGVGNGSSLQYSCLENPIDRVYQATVHGVAKSQTQVRVNVPSCAHTHACAYTHTLYGSNHIPTEVNSALFYLLWFPCCLVLSDFMLFSLSRNFSCCLVILLMILKLLFHTFLKSNM